MVAFLGDHQVLDLSAVTDKSLAATTPGIGGFDLGGHHNALVISLSDVLTLGEQDLFIDDGKHQLIVNGKEGDSVDLQNSHVPGLSDGEWRHNGTAEVGGVFITWLNIQARTPNCWLSTKFESKCINVTASVPVVETFKQAGEMQKAALEYGAAFYKLCNNRAEARELLDTFCQFHGFTHIRTRRHGEKQVLRVIRNSESFDKRLQAFARDAFTARQFL